MNTIGLRLSTHGIAWAVNNAGAITAEGFTRIVCKPDDMNEHTAGRNPPGMQDRRMSRAMRRNNERKKRRIAQVRTWIKRNLGLDVDAVDPDTMTKVILHRERCVREVLGAAELAVVLLTAAKRRGWKRSAEDDEDELGEFLATVERNTQAARAAGGIGAYQAQVLRTGKRVRTRTYFREMHEDEFVAMAQTQAAAFPCMTGEPLTKLRRIIFFQRPLRSMKSSVEKCSYEPDRPVCNRLDPYFQTLRVYTETEHLRVYDAYGNDKAIGDAELAAVREVLLSGKDLTALALLKLLGHKKGDAVSLNYEKGLSGHQTRKLIPQSQHLSDAELYDVWQVLHSVKEPEARKKGIAKLTGLVPEEEWATVKLPKTWYSSFSHKAVKKLIPHLAEGCTVRTALKRAGYDKPAKNAKPELRGMNLVQKKWFDHAVNLVRALEQKHGKAQRVVVASESMLLAGRKKRARMASERRKEDKLVDQLMKEVHDTIGPRELGTKDRQRLLLWHECGGISPLEPERPITLAHLLEGKGKDAVTVDHIVPFSRLFDDAPGNKILLRQSVNKAKGDLTALEYVRKQKQDEEAYIARIDALKLPPVKRGRLKTDQENIPRNFVTRMQPRGPFVRALSTALGRNAQWCPMAVAGHLLGRWNIKLLPGDLGNHVCQAVALTVVDEAYIERLDGLTDHPGEHLRHLDMPKLRFTEPDEIRLHHYRRSSFRGKGGRMEPKVALHQDTHYGRIAPERWIDKTALKKGMEVVEKRGEKLKVRVPEVVVRYAVQSLVAKDLPYVVDVMARKALQDHLLKYGNDAEKAWANYEEDPPLLFDCAMRHVRLYTKLSKVRNIKGGQYIVKEGVIDHLAVYRDANGRVSFAASSPLDVAERRRMGSPLTPLALEGKGELLRVVRYGDTFDHDGTLMYVNTIDGDSGRVGLLPVMRASKEAVSVSLRKVLDLDTARMCSTDNVRLTA